MTRRRDGWCYLASESDVDDALWCIFGRHDDTEARAIVEAHQGEPVGALLVTRGHQRAIPIRGWCPQCGSDGKHYHYIDSHAGRGAFLVTFVYLEQT
jgi:hypothetical protein